VLSLVLLLSTNHVLSSPVGMLEVYGNLKKGKELRGRDSAPDLLQKIVSLRSRRLGSPCNLFLGWV